MLGTSFGFLPGRKAELNSHCELGARLSKDRLFCAG